MKYYKFDNLNIRHGFFYKPYSFNKNLNKEEYIKNLELVKEELNLIDIVEVTQKHTNIVKKVTIDNMFEETIADAMITNLKDVGLAIKVADCQAILVYDEKNKVIANVHSGWKGTVEKILGNVIDIMITDYNCDTKNIKAYICPSILQDHFEVDKDVYDIFKEKFSKIDKYTIYKKEINKYYIDTVKLNKDYLISLGLKKTNIYLSNLCTMCDNRFHSYRIDKEKSGRNLAIISL